MNISCPDCSAVYEVDFPDLSEDGEMKVKCAKCQCVFAVQGGSGGSATEGDEAGAEPQAEIASEDIDDLQSPELSQDDELDDFLDNLIEREISDDARELLTGDGQEGPLSASSGSNVENGQDTPSEEENNWAKAFEDGSDGAQVTENPEGAVSIQDEGETKPYASDEVEDLWSKAFSDQELETASAIVEPTAPGKINPAFTDISLGPGDGDAFGLQYDDEDGDFDEFDLNPKKKKFGPFTLPTGKSGSLAIAGIFTGLLMLAGSVYFVTQTFAPQELAEIKKPASAIPEGLIPRDNPEDNIFPTESESVIPPPEDITGNGPVQEKKSGIAEDLAKSKILGKSEGVSQIEKRRETNANRFAALDPAETMVTMSAILPVAYDANDIKILSFTLQLDLTDQNTARRMRETLPVYENIMVASVETLMSKHFFNDIIYVKEKLRKQFMSDFNKSLQGGRVRTARFREFLIQ